MVAQRPPHSRPEQREALEPAVEAGPVLATASALPSVPLPAPIRVLIWRDAADDDAQRWLLPAAAVLEVLRCDAPEPLSWPINTAPAEPVAAPPQCLLGTLSWRRGRFPLLRLGAEPGDVAANAAASAGPAAWDDWARRARPRVIVCPTLDGDCGFDALGFLALGTPVLAMLRDGEVTAAEPAPDQAADTPFVSARLCVQGQAVSVPDLDALTRVLAPLAPMFA
jgi:hypothetical protein